MQPILSATNTYSYALAKGLDNMLEPLSLNQHTVTDIFDFVDELPRDINITPGDLLVSYDVSSLFTNVPLDETIKILADRAFRNNWFNSEYDLNISKRPYRSFGCGYQGPAFPIQWLLVRTDRRCSNGVPPWALASQLIPVVY